MRMCIFRPFGSHLVLSAGEMCRLLRRLKEVFCLRENLMRQKLNSSDEFNFLKRTLIRKMKNDKKRIFGVAYQEGMRDWAWF